MPRHARAVDRRLRAIRLSTVSVIWLGGLGAGLVGLLAAAAKYGCAASNHGFGCSTSGEIAGIGLVLFAVVVVIVVTVTTYDRPARRVLTIGGYGLAALMLCAVAARALLATT